MAAIGQLKESAERRQAREGRGERAERARRKMTTPAKDVGHSALLGQPGDEFNLSQRMRKAARRGRHGAASCVARAAMNSARLRWRRTTQEEVSRARESAMEIMLQKQAKCEQKDPFGMTCALFIPRYSLMNVTHCSSPLFLRTFFRVSFLSLESSVLSRA